MAATDKPVFPAISEPAKLRTFAASELVPCEACSRPNPPTRATCLYCGGALAVTEQNAFRFAPAAEAEPSDGKVFHIVATTNGALLNVDAPDEVANALNLKPGELNLLLSHPTGAPLLAANSAKQAEIVSEKLRGTGIETATIPDEQLNLSTPNQEIAAFEFGEASISAIVRRTREKVSAPWRDVALMVLGRLYLATTEVEQKRNRRKDVIGERQLITDEAVLDIYFANADIGWRIRGAGFNFSCLGEEKKLTAFENFSALTELLRRRASEARFDDSYLRLRPALTSVWPIESRVGVKEKRRTAFGDFDSAATTNDNQAQFTRYSRLLRLLHETSKHGQAA